MTISLCVLFLFCSVAAWAKEPETPELTYKQAVERALTNSAILKSGKYSIDQAYEMRKFSSQNLQYVPLGPSDSSVTRFFYSLQQADLNWQMARKNYALLEDSVELAVHQTYNSILQGQENLKACEKTLRSIEKQRLIAAISYKVGITSQLAMIQADANLAGAKDSYAEALKSLDDAYQKFNYLVGLWPEDQPVLTEIPVFEKVSIIDLNNYIERMLEENPSLWQVEENVKMASTILDTFDPVNSLEPYKSKEIAVDKAKITAEDAREQAKKTLRTLYYTIGQLEDKYPVVVQQVKVAEEGLRVTRVELEVGVATSTDVAMAEAALAQANQQLLGVVCQHDLLRLAFKKPWAYTM